MLTLDYSQQLQIVVLSKGIHNLFKQYQLLAENV